MIEIDHLTKQFGPITAVDDISLSVERGEVLGFLGPNGAGKSTTMKMVTGFLRPTAGTARVVGFDVLEDSIEVKRRVGYLPEGAPMWPDMTPTTFPQFIAGVRGYDGAAAQERIDRSVGMTQLGEVMAQPIDTLSKGFKRRLGLAQALLHDPEVLILAAPPDGFDPNQKHEVRELIRGMAGEKAIIISTHILEEVEAVCARAVIIAKGRVVADSTPEELLRRSAWHNAVMVRAKDVAAATAVVTGLAGIAEVETVDADLIMARSQNGESVVEAVGSALREKAVAFDEIHVERGRLDDVFREITAGE